MQDGSYKWLKLASYVNRDLFASYYAPNDDECENKNGSRQFP